MEASDPTHALFDAEGRYCGEVRPEGYGEDADLRPLPDDFWSRGFYRWDGEAFVDDVGAAQAAKWAEVKARRRELDNGVAILPEPLGPIQVDGESKVKIHGLFTMALVAASAEKALPPGSDPIFLEDFTRADNEVVTLTSELALELGMSVARYVSAVFAVSRALRVQIEAESATVESVLSIDVEAAFAAALASGEG